MARLWPPLAPSPAGIAPPVASVLTAILLAPAALTLCLGVAPAVAQDGTRPPPRRASAALEEAFGYVKDKAKLSADAPDTVSLAAQDTPEGHWRFVSRTGEMFTAGTADEMKRVVTVLHPEAKPGAPLAIYLAEDTVLGPGSKLRALPSKSRKYIIVNSRGYLLLPLEGEPRIVRVRPHVSIEIADNRRLKEALARLDGPLARARVRLLALEPGGPNGLPQDPPSVTGATVPVEAIDPAHLATALTRLAGQVAVVCARGAGDLIYVKPAARSEPERLPVHDLMRAARTAAEHKADVALMVLQFPAAHQRPAEEPCPDGGRPAPEVTLGDILEAAAADSRQTPVAIALGGGLKALDVVVVGDPVAGTRLGDAHVHAATPSLVGDASLPLLLSALYVALLLVGWLGTPVTRQFWGRTREASSTKSQRRFWIIRPKAGPPPTRISLWNAGRLEDYSGRTGYWAAQAVSFLMFALLFQPLTGVFTAFYNLLPQIWHALAALVRPIVWLWRAWDRFARRSAGGS